jgi:hypothetical protein
VIARVLAFVGTAVGESGADDDGLAPARALVLAGALALAGGLAMPLEAGTLDRAVALQPPSSRHSSRRTDPTPVNRAAGRPTRRWRALSIRRIG